MKTVKVTTHFDVLLSQIRGDIEGFEPDALCLCATNICDCGFCKSEEEEREGKSIHSIICGNIKLELRTEKAKQHFIQVIENEFMDGMPYNIWYSLQKNRMSD